MALVASSAAAENVRLHAAGSLRSALSEVAERFEAVEGTRVEATFGASGLLRDRIAGGETAEVFASANLEHPSSLRAEGKSSAVVLFARNRLCGLARPGFAVDTATMIERMLDPSVKLGTSTPKADPAGDYAWEAFRKIDALRPGSFGILDRKALQLVGGPTSPRPVPNRSSYGVLIEQGSADLILTYCTNAREAAAQVQGASIVPLPDAISVGAEYGLTVMNGASSKAHRFAMFILSPEGQRILERVGFGSPALPSGR